MRSGSPSRLPRSSRKSDEVRRPRLPRHARRPPELGRPSTESGRKVSESRRNCCRRLRRRPVNRQVGAQRRRRPDDVGLRVGVRGEPVELGGGVQTGGDGPAEGQFVGGESGDNRHRVPIRNERRRLGCSGGRARVRARDCVRALPQLDELSIVHGPTQTPFSEHLPDLRPGECRSLGSGERQELIGEWSGFAHRTTVMASRFSGRGVGELGITRRG